MDGGQLHATLAGIAEELEGAGPDHSVARDQLGRMQVALQRGVAHELHVAEIGESFAANRIAGEFAVEPEVQAGEVLNGVGVLGAGEPAHGYPAGIARVLLGELVQGGADPVGSPLPFLVGGLRRLGGRHASLFQGRRHFPPLLKVFADGGRCGQLLQIDSAGGRLAVALEAVPLQHSMGLWQRGRGENGGGDEGNEKRRVADGRHAVLGAPFKLIIANATRVPQGDQTTHPGDVGGCQMIAPMSIT